MGNQYAVDVDVRVRDIDRNQHVNHVVFVSYMEYARNKYWWGVFGHNDLSKVVAKVDVEYRRPIELHDDVRVLIDLREVRNSSFAHDYEILSNGDTSAVAETVLVHVDDEGKPRSLPDDFRRTMLEYHQG